MVIDAYLKVALNSHSPAATKTQSRAYTRDFFRLKCGNVPSKISSVAYEQTRRMKPNSLQRQLTRLDKK